MRLQSRSAAPSPGLPPMQKKHMAIRMDDHMLLEQGTGIEPASEAWEATVITNILTLHMQFRRAAPAILVV